jgi:hypothetical protein
MVSGKMSMRRNAAILAAIVTVVGVGAEADEVSVEELSCRAIVDAGWKNMPDVAGYVFGKPGSENLGYGSECHLGGLVFAQCWLEPRWTVKGAVKVLIQKAAHKEQLPKTPVCGA